VNLQLENGGRIQLFMRFILFFNQNLIFKFWFLKIWTLSYSDSNSDSIGDLNGIIQKLDYLRYIGVSAIFLRPIMRMESTGLGVIEYKELTNKLGSFEQFSDLVKIAHRKGFFI
jgi:glycosidase